MSSKFSIDCVLPLWKITTIFHHQNMMSTESRIFVNVSHGTEEASFSKTIQEGSIDSFVFFHRDCKKQPKGDFGHSDHVR